MKPILSSAVLLSLFGGHQLFAGDTPLTESGLLNIAIPTTPEGIYLDVETGITGLAEFAGWDVNFTFGGSEIYNSDPFQAVRLGAGNTDAFINASAGYEVGPTSTFYAIGFGGSLDHLGNSAGQFAPGTPGYLAFQFKTNDGFATLHGWMRVTLTANTAGGTIHEWTYDNTGSSLFVPIPEPTTWATLAGLAALGLAVKRRRRN